MAGFEIRQFNNSKEYYAQAIYNENWNAEYEQVCGNNKQNIRPRAINLNSAPSSLKQQKAAIDEDESIEKHMKNAIGVATLITEHLLCHPFTVLRRQCQVHNKSRREHLFPFSLLPVIYHISKRQGIAKLWKGLGSTLVVRGMTLAIEDCITKFTPWPKEINRKSSWKSCCQHVLLKCVTLAIITPFYSASLVETVQSDITSECPGIFDVFKEGLCRLISWSSPMKGRMLPVWTLVVPTVAYGLFKYGFSEVVRNCTSTILHINLVQKKQNQGAVPRDLSRESAIQEIEMTSALVAMSSAEIIFYPLETVLHRLHLQGTRTIIDNLDSGREVIPILTSYEGALDCYRTALCEEGTSGLYKGFGALVLQLVAYISVIQLTKYVLNHATQLFRDNSPPPTYPPNKNRS
uniref:Solute carrier family 25 member 46 n=1 Tax=Clastoptera arizonana TaxID=38151 RepID=A0A1B6DH59_9HEMI